MLGHKAVEQFVDYNSSFSSLCLLEVFLKHSKQVLNHSPYTPIIATDDTMSILHYKEFPQVKKTNGVLIDAGCSYLNYASDISRTHAKMQAHMLAKELISQVDILQRKLCAMVKHGIFMCSLQLEAHKGILQILIESGICNKEVSLDTGITKYFYMHGLGHHLGLQVHDVSGLSALPFTGVHNSVLPVMEAWEENLVGKMRFSGKLQQSHTITIEPGIYFNKILMEKLKNSDLKTCINWKLVDFLTASFSGIRIEDNILVLKESHHNLTRNA
jgi:Xaa-Pro dipeptidase